MEAQEVFVLKFQLDLVLEIENGPFRVLIPFLSSPFNIFLLVHILFKCNCNAYDANEMIKMHKPP